MNLLAFNVPTNISLPALLLDVNAFDENCQMIAHKANGKTIRIATKSIRSVPVLRQILASNSVYIGLMSFSPKEAIFLAEKGFEDILLGYPCWDSSALQQIARLNRDGNQIISMVDSIEHIEHLAKISNETNGVFYLCIDIDMSTTFGSLHFGVRRSPINTEEGIVQIAKKIKENPQLKLLGVMGYEAQIAGVGDKLPSQQLKNQVVSLLKKRSIHNIYQRRKRLVEILEKEGMPIQFVNGGGTGSLHTTSQDNTVTELTAGSGFYAPLLFDYYRDFHYQPSLFFALQIVRKPTNNIYTCLGGGYIASGPHGKDKVPQPVYPPGGKLLPFEGAGEVQTPVYYENETLEIGDAIIFRAAKAGEICERFGEIVCLENNQVVETFSTYRGEGQCFL
ncbi:amino acid deaminase/aldolase [Ornithinibacillus halotolerans]|uniref:amino acid deaminase/aldolase n=1 Tax=Ornithinibacillus halotolerans TaxID=1274357 RepID=UPI00166C38C0|nr:amino acid deaminase/aldolase [Ornithinibacillus halotolerans]